MGAPAGHGKLRELPRAARHQQSAIVEGADASRMRFVSRYQPAPYDADTAQFSSGFQPGLHELPLQNSRIKPPVGKYVSPLGRRHVMKRRTTLILGVVITLGFVRASVAQETKPDSREEPA